MDLFTLNRDFFKQDVITEFESFIWTERYYGDSEIELVVPASLEALRKLPLGIFLSIDQSDEIMILETVEIEGENLKFFGISLLSWFNNRFVRATAPHQDNIWIIPEVISEQPPMVPGYVLWFILYNMCHPDSGYLTPGSVDTGIPEDQKQRLAIPGLTLKDYDKSGEPTIYVVKFGPVYDALREIATSYEIGMQLTLESVIEGSYELGFRSYKGLDRTSGQTVNPVVRFSAQIDSFTDIKEIQSIAALKTQVFAFASQLDPAFTTGVFSEAGSTGQKYVGFDLRTYLLFSDITADDLVDTDSVEAVLNNQALIDLRSKPYIRVVDGEIGPIALFQYGVHYNLGDIVEVQGNTGVINTARVTEYIRVQDKTGERSYPTVTLLD